MKREWHYTIYKRVGTPENLRKEGAVEIRVAGERAKPGVPVPRGWKFGCRYAGRGDGRNRIYEIAGGREEIIHEAPPKSSYAPLKDGEVDGESRNYGRAKKWQAGFSELSPGEVGEVIGLLAARSGPRVLVTGGHYMPYLHDLDKVRGPPLATLEFSMRLMEGLTRAGRHADLGIIVNDLHMGTGENGRNETREGFWEGYRLPQAFQEIIGRSMGEVGEPKVIVVGERVLYNRFDHMRHLDIPNPRLVEGWKPGHQDTKCKGALVYFLKFAASALGYESCIQVFPACDTNSRKAAHAAREIYGSRGVPGKLHIVHTTCGC